MIMKQNTGKGVVIMDEHKYTEKCLSKPTIQEYHRLYLTGSCSGKFYGNAKIHKFKLNDKVDQLQIRPTVSNIGTAAYNLARHRAKLLSPLSKSKYTTDSTKHFMENIKQEKILDEYKMVSFDVNSLFTNVPLEKTIDITLERIYDRKEINTQIARPEMKELLP